MSIQQILATKQAISIASSDSYNPLRESPVSPPLTTYGAGSWTYPSGSLSNCVREQRSKETHAKTFRDIYNYYTTISLAIKELKE
jgi:hypothetical protein